MRVGIVTVLSAVGSLTMKTTRECAQEARDAKLAHIREQVEKRSPVVTTASRDRGPIRRHARAPGAIP